MGSLLPGGCGGVGGGAAGVLVVYRQGQLRTGNLNIYKFRRSNWLRLTSN